MQRFQQLKEHGLFLGLLTVVAVLRFSPLFDYQFTYDEITVLQRVNFNSFFDLMQGAVKIDAHPGLLQVFIYYIYKVVGPETWVIKLPFIIMSLGGLVYAYLFGWKNFSKQAGLAATVILGFGLIYVYHAPIARMYSAGIFFSLGMLYHFGEYVFRKNNSRRHLFCMGLFMLLCALNQHVNALYAGTLFVGGFFLLDAGRKKAYLITGGITLLCYLPNVPITLYQLGVGGIGADQGGWLEAPRLSVLPELLNVLCGSGWSLGVVACLLVVAIIGGRQRGRWRIQLFLVTLFMVNFLIVFLYSVLRAPIYQHTVMLFSGCGLILALASGLESRSTLVNQMVMLVLTVWLVNETYFRKDYLTQCVKTIYEYQFERTVYYKKVYGDKEVYPIFFEADSVMRRIYFDKYHTAFDCKINYDSIINHGSREPFDINGKNTSPVLLFQNFVSTVDADYLVMGSAPPLQQALVLRYFPYLIENRQTQAIHYKVYSKRASDKSRVVPDDRVIFDSKLTTSHTFTTSSELGKSALHVNAENEFPCSIRGRYRDAVGAEGQVVLASATLQSDQAISGAECCISVRHLSPDNSLYYTASAARDYQTHEGKVEVLSDAFIGNFHEFSQENDELSVYIWNRSREQFILSDLTFKVVEHWPNRWHFWD